MINEIDKGLRFMHVVIFSEDAGIFALARESVTKKVHLFLITGHEEKIYKRDGRHNRWRLLEHENLFSVLASINHAVNAGLPVLKIDGRAESVININN
jgi:hypothetical protein